MSHSTARRPAQQQAFQTLIKVFHERGLDCPNCHEHDGLQVHEDHRRPWHVRYRCGHCNHTFTPWTGTPLQGSHHTPTKIVRIMQSVLAKESDSQLARELRCDRGKLSAFRHKLQHWMNQLPKEDFTKMATILKKRVK